MNKKMREYGFYWVKLRGGKPDQKTIVAEYYSCFWCLTGRTESMWMLPYDTTEDGWALDDNIIVLSDRLIPPE